MTDPYDVLIIGGGVSGLAAAASLVRCGRRIALVEQSGKLGGRCYSYVDGKTGDVVDNGQHVLLGAYHETLRYLAMAGTRHALRAEPALTLPLIHPAKGFVPFRSASLPAPLHLPAGILRFPLLSLGERKSLLTAGMSLRRWGSAREQRLAVQTIDEWLDELGQGRTVRDCLWHPIAVSVMNEEPSRASALLFARSLRQAFFGSRADSSILIPTIGQTELYVEPVERFLRAGGAALELLDAVRAITMDGDRASGVVLKSGKFLPARTVIASVPWFSIGKILPPQLAREEPYRSLDGMASSPIVSIHLWFGEEMLDHDFAGLIGSRVQWVFNRRRLMGGTERGGGYLSAVISAAREYVDLSNEQLVAVAVEDLTKIRRGKPMPDPVRSVVIREQRATFSPTPQAERLRPGCATQVKNLFLAGDWTATGLPATIEGAIQSGFRAAELADEFLSSLV